MGRRYMYLGGNKGKKKKRKEKKKEKKEKKRKKRKRVEVKVCCLVRNATHLTMHNYLLVTGHVHSCAI